MYKLEVKNGNLFYGDKHALKNIHISIEANAVTAFIGPSGCGKSSLLRCFNRMNDLIENARTEGEFLLDGQNIYDGSFEVYDLRKRIGMVFQRPNPFPKTISVSGSSEMEITPDQIYVHITLREYQKKGEKEKGVALCDKAIEMDPSLAKNKQKISMPGM